ncbi:MAG: hypothetical protein RBU29_06940 [bacterium]|jgi:hypothetical protein|nr:hypothetical protein [bacterium]
METVFWNMPLWFWLIICLGVAVLYAVVWPKPRPGVPPRGRGFTLILRWFHSLVWVLLAGACVLGMVGWGEAAQGAAAASLVVYGVFLLAYGVDRKR